VSELRDIPNPDQPPTFPPIGGRTLADYLAIYEGVFKETGLRAHWTELQAINAAGGSSAPGAGSITQLMLAKPSVGTPELFDFAVATAKLADGAVTDQKVTSVAYSKILNAPWADDGSFLTPNPFARGVRLPLDMPLRWAPTGIATRPSIVGFSSGEMRLSALSGQPVSIDFGGTGGVVVTKTQTRLDYGGLFVNLAVQVQGIGSTFGLSTPFQAEYLNCQSGILLGTALGANPGTIQWNGTNFQGRTATAWVNLDTQGSAFVDAWTDANGYLSPTKGPTYPVHTGWLSVAGKLDVTDQVTVAPVGGPIGAVTFRAVQGMGTVGNGVTLWKFDVEQSLAPQPTFLETVSASESWGANQGCNWNISTTKTGTSAPQLRLMVQGDGRTYLPNTLGLAVGGGVTPREMLDVSGAIILTAATAATPANGTLQFAAGKFQGRVGGAWVDIPGAAAGFWTSDPTYQFVSPTPFVNWGILLASGSGVQFADGGKGPGVAQTRQTGIKADDNSLILNAGVSGIQFKTWDSATLLGLWNATNLTLNLPLVLPADPIAPLQAATKQYVDAHASGGGGGIPEAPSDGTLYGRKNAVWSAVPAVPAPIWKTTSPGQIAPVAPNSILWQLARVTTTALQLSPNGDGTGSTQVTLAQGRMQFSAGNSSTPGGAYVFLGNYTGTLVTIDDSYGGASEFLSVNGAITIGVTQAAAPVAGSIQWDGANFLGYNGAAWVNFGGGGGGGIPDAPSDDSIYGRQNATWVKTPTLWNDDAGNFVLVPYVGRGVVLSAAAASAPDGTLHYTGTKFQGRAAGAWVDFAGAAGGGIKQVVAVPIPVNLSITNAGWGDILTIPITTSGGWVLLVCSPGWAVNGGSGGYLEFGWGRDAVSPTVVEQNLNYSTGADFSQPATYPLSGPIGMDHPPAGAHVYHLITICATPNVLQTQGYGTGMCWAVEFG
jgi:hypothetical protein